jgi:hypothetical protein
MGWLNEAINDSQVWLQHKPEEKYLSDDLMKLCSLGTYTHIMTGELGYGMADTHI